MNTSMVLLSVVVVLVLVGNYLQAKERTADRKARLARDKRIDALLDKLSAIQEELIERNRNGLG